MNSFGVVVCSILQEGIAMKKFVVAIALALAVVGGSVAMITSHPQVAKADGGNSGGG
jgi:hypothetical protein